MRRRIEITVYRHSAVVFRDQSGNKNRPSEQVSPVSAPVEEPDNGKGELTTIEIARSRELKLLLDALVKNDGDLARAARQLGLSRNDFLSRLCGFGFSIK